MNLLNDIHKEGSAIFMATHDYNTINVPKPTLRIEIIIISAQKQVHYLITFAKVNTLKELLQKESIFAIAGPCAIEGEEMAFKIAENEGNSKHSRAYVWREVSKSK